ncbi:MAG: transketolase [Caldisericia bacterium]|nr:transketolase [Caldisericia bacterium]
MEKPDYNDEKIIFLAQKAQLLRARVLQMINKAPKEGAGHPGGSLSAADIVTVLYFDIMNIDPKNPTWEDRDRFVMSKGHAVPIVYAALAERGFFKKRELLTLRRIGSILQGHPDMTKTPGIDISTGSLGQGLSVAVGMAIAGKMDKNNYNVFCLLSDGELNEGQIWEAVQSAVKYKLDNLIAIVDYNGIQNDGFTDEIMPLNSLSSIFDSFGFSVMEIDGHNIEEIKNAFSKCKELTGKPNIIIAHTVKGKGVSFMENDKDWHTGSISDEQLKIALKDIDYNGDDLYE